MIKVQADGLNGVYLVDEFTCTDIVSNEVFDRHMFELELGQSMGTVVVNMWDDLRNNIQIIEEE
jgi:hypothetical protein